MRENRRIRFKKSPPGTNRRNTEGYPIHPANPQSLQKWAPGTPRRRNESGVKRQRLAKSLWGMQFDPVPLLRLPRLGAWPPSAHHTQWRIWRGVLCRW